MSIYFENLTKVRDGYNKIVDTINSITTSEQLNCASNMVEAWVNLGDMYCGQVWKDKSNKHRKRDSNKLAEVIEVLFNDLKQVFQQRVQDLQPEQYTGICNTTRIKGLNEISTEYYG